MVVQQEDLADEVAVADVGSLPVEPTQEEWPEESVIGANIFRYRTNRNRRMSQWDLAMAVGKSRQLIATLENARDPARTQGVNPRLDTLKVIARALGVEVRDLLVADPETQRVILSGAEVMTVHGGRRRGDLLAAT